MLWIPLPLLKNMCIMKALIGAGNHLRAAGIPPEVNHPKDYHLLPQRLRRTTVARSPASPDQHSLVGGELSGAILFSGGNLLIGDAACGSTRYTLGCITNASVSFLSICFPQAEDQCLSRAKLRCCLSKHPAALVCGRGRRLGGARR